MINKSFSAAFATQTNKKKSLDLLNILLLCKKKPPKIKLLHELLNMGKRSKSIGSSNGSVDDTTDDTTPLTEAENYALYTSVAPHVAMSEFDESSMHYIVR